MSNYEIGDRIELHPATDRWMRGDRYGEVTKIGKRFIYAKMDRSGGIARIHPDNIQFKIINGKKVAVNVS